MAHVYILYSKSANLFYIGSCDNLDERLQQHSTKEFADSFTALKASDWQLYFDIPDLEYEQARQIEQHIKKMKSRKYLSDIKSYPDIALKLKERYK